MKDYWPLSIPIIIGLFLLYVFCNSLNPDSYFCDYKIYQTTNNTYEVWWNCKTQHKEYECKTYDEAKFFQSQRYESLKAFMSASPKGKRVK